MGIMFGRQAKSIAAELGISVQEAGKIIDDFYYGFPEFAQWNEDLKIQVEEKGYLTTNWGRRRYFPQYNLPDFIVKESDGTETARTREFVSKLKAFKNQYKEKIKLINYLESAGFRVTDNTFLKSETERQFVNLKISGSSADQSKITIAALGEDKKLKNLGFRLCNFIHDENVGLVPINELKEIIPRFQYILCNAAPYNHRKEGLEISTDIKISKAWDGDIYKYEDIH